MKNKKYQFYANTKDHPLRTRREFLSRWAKGVIGSSLVFPGMAISSDYSDDFPNANCDSTPDEGLASALIVDLNGGGHLAGSNFIVSNGQDGSQLSGIGYNPTGLGIQGSEILDSDIDDSLGIAMHTSSGILNGIKAVIDNTGDPSSYYNCVEGGIFCSVTFDDTTRNIINPMYWICNSGCVGKFGSSIGSKSSRSGAFSGVPDFNVESKHLPTPIQNESELRNLLQISRLANKETKENQKKLLKLIEDMNINSLVQRKNKFSESLLNRLYCEYQIPRKVLTDENISLEKLIVPSGGDIESTFNHINSLSDSSIIDTFKVYSHLLNNKFFGVGSISYAGFDYHNGTRSSGDNMDRELGYNIGGMIKSAVDQGKNLFIVLITDGGVGVDLYNGGSLDNGNIPWVTDRGTASAAVMLAINGKGKTRPVMRQNNTSSSSSGRDYNSIRQIGQMNVGGIGGNLERSFASTNTSFRNLTSNGGMGLASGIFANYLALHGLEGRLGEFAGIDVFTTNSGSVLDDYLCFDKTF